MAFTAYTLSDIRTRLASKVESVPFWPDDELLDAINESLLLFNLLTGYWRTSLSFPSTPNDDYAIGAGMTYQARVLYDGTVMEPCSLHAMNNGIPSWRGDVAGDDGVPTRPIFWIPLGLDLIAIWPRPADTTHTITVEGVQATPILALDADYVNLSEDAFHAILACALVILTFKEGSERFQGVLPLFKQFLTYCGEVNGQLKASAIYRRFLGINAGSRTTRGLPSQVPGTAE